MTAPPLRIGLITDGAELRLFDAELIHRLEAANIAQVVVVIEQVLAPKSLAAKALHALRRRALLRSIAFRIAVWIERRILAYAKPGIEDLFRTIAVGEVCAADRMRVIPLVSASGLVHRFAAADIDAIKTRKLDLILRAGSGILRGDILSAAAGGIVSFHHGDNRVNRGGPPGFWEVLEHRDYTGFTIQRLSEELDGGEVLARGELTTRPSYLLNQHHLFRFAVGGMVDLLARMQRGSAGARESEAVSWYSNVLYTTPSVLGSLTQLLSFLQRVVLTKLARRLFAWHEVWELRLLQGDWRSLVLRRAQALSPPRGRFWADPFIVRHGDERVIFFEEYVYQRRKAHIAALVSKDGNPFTYAGPVLETAHHLSFPYTFRYRDQFFMCPETYQAGAIQLWRCVSWPLKWVFHKTILSGVSAADTMLAEHGGRWWLFTNLDRDGADDHCRELHIFHAASPLADAWTPLPDNPVVTGASRARNAGLLTRAGKLYRLAQSHGFDRYGQSLRLNEIVTLSEAAYDERPVAELSPNPALRSTGIHHLSACEGSVVFDATRSRFFWSEALNRLVPQALQRRERDGVRRARADYPVVDH